VETALVMPLTVFIILGVIQMCLLTQSRALLKYAAYRAARAGALNNGCMDKMQESARAVLLPLMQGTSSLMNTSDMTSYMTSYAEGVLNHSLTDPMVQSMEVRICGPLKNWVQGGATFTPQGSGSEVDFDHLWNTEAAGGTPVQEVESYERLKLKVQVKFNQRLVIPFVDATIFKLWQGSTTYMSAESRISGGPQRRGIHGPLLFAHVRQLLVPDAVEPLREHVPAPDAEHLLALQLQRHWSVTGGNP
jgi:hypothetical protein